MEGKFHGLQVKKCAPPSVALGVDGVQLFWNGPSIEIANAQNVLTQNNLKYGLYTVTAMRSGGCTVTRQHSFAEPMEIINSTITDNRCSGSKTGGVTIEVVGGSGKYNYKWSVFEDADSKIAIDHSGLDDKN